MSLLHKLTVLSALFLGLNVSTPSAYADEPKSIDYESFLSNHDMIWDKVPDGWQVAPFSGNGNVGFLLYQGIEEKKNTIGLHVGRHDYYDHRLPHEDKHMLWIYRCRLPLGHFKLQSEGDITSVDLRLSLWNAELTGTIHTTTGSYNIHALTHTSQDVIYVQTDASEHESVVITWHPDAPYSSVKTVFDEGGGPKNSLHWDDMRKAPYPAPPKYELSKQGEMNFCLQKLYNHRGETTTGWRIEGDAAGKQQLITSIHHSFPEKNSLSVVTDNLTRAQQSLTEDHFLQSHRQWWHAYYPQSFLTLNDTEKEAFYWIQIYKFASATRGNGPILDLMGPWYNKTFWPMVWGDLNVQLIYWTHLTANRLEAGESLVNNVDKYHENLVNNAPKRWADSATMGALLPQDMDSPRVLPDMLVWLLHDYWLHCEYAGDRDRMREGLFPILKKAVNSYLNYFAENPVESANNTIHFKESWSPEYPNGKGQDINFSLALVRWSCQTLLDLNDEHQLADPLAQKWQYVLDHLVDYQTDDNGLRIGKDIPFDTPHRHYSHLLGFYPLAVITPETKEDKALLKTSVDHWLKVTLESDIEVKAMPATGYTCTGACSMYAWLGDGQNAYRYLDMFIKHPGVAPTTMYAEVQYNPVIESPLSYATSIHDMLLQSWGGKIRVFAGAPERWSDIAFQNLRTQGAFIVSAKKQQGLTQFVTVESLVGSRCLIQTDIPNPNIYINGKPATADQAKLTSDGFYELAINKGDKALLSATDIESTDLSIEPVPITEENKNLFGLSEKTKRLPGHKHYYPAKPPKSAMSSDK